MHDNIEQIALHEAGHSLGHILTGLKFSIVTIDPSALKTYTDGKSLGYLVPVKAYSAEGSDSYSILSPHEFFQSFREDVTVIAGYVAQRIFSNDFDRNGSKTDFLNLNSNRLINQPEPFRTAYKRFLIIYTFQLLSLNVHKQMLLKIADELLKKKTMKYDEVKNIVDQYVETA